MFKFIKDIIAPKKCYSCGREGHFLCENCFMEIEKHYYFDEMCYVCKKYSKNFSIHEKCKNNIFYDKLIILTHYKIKVIKKLILALKFYSKREIADEFAMYMSDKFIKYSKKELKNYKKSDFFIINTPTTFLRRILRGYNQTELLSRSFSKLLQLNFKKKLVLKSRYTKQQSTLNKKDRLRNLYNSFEINKKYKEGLKGKIVILIDDVVSTGATLNEIAKILKENGVKEIICLTIASGY